MSRKVWLSLLLASLLCISACHRNSASEAAPSAKWKLNVGPGRNPLALGSDGTVYALVDSGALVAVSSDGTQKWSRDAALPHKWMVGPSLGSDDTIYIVGHNRIVGFTSGGSTRIDLPIGTAAASWAISVTDDFVYAQCMRTGTCALSRDMGLELRWHVSQDTPNSVVEPDGTVIFGNDCIVAMQSAAQPKWIFPSSRGLVPDDEHDRWYDVTPPEHDVEVEGLSATNDGTIYVNRRDGLTAFDSNGQVKWKFEAPLFRGHQALVASDGSIYMPSLDRHLYALRPDGKLLWKLNTSAIVAQPVLGSSGTIFFVDGHALRAVTLDGRTKWATDIDSDVLNYGYATGSAATLSDDGTLYVASRAGTLYAFPVGERLMNSPWPKFQANTRNSGQVNQ